VKMKNITAEDRKNALRQLILGQAQIISATVCLYFLIKTASAPGHCLRDRRGPRNSAQPFADFSPPAAFQLSPKSFVPSQ